MSKRTSSTIARYGKPAGTLAQRATWAVGAFYLALGVVGLLLNPDFGTGSKTSARQFLIDWNGWHALLSLALVPPALYAAQRHRWAAIFLAYNAALNTVTAAWALVDTTPLGILDLPHVATDVALHLAVAATSLTVLLVQTRSDRPQSARPR